MVGEHLGEVLRSPDGLDPGRGATVQLGPLRPRELRVGDVADEDVGEGVLRFLRHRRATLAAHEAAALELVQALLDGRPIKIHGAREPPAPERTPEDRRILEQLLLLGLEEVEAGGDDPLHRRGQLGDSAALRQDARVLLGVQRVPPRADEELGARLGVERRPRDELADELAVSSSLSGEREIVRAFGLPPLHAGRRSKSSGRAVQTTRIETPLAHSTRWSTKSRRSSPDQWRSSITSTSGPCSARPSKNRRQAANASARPSPPAGSEPVPRPTSGRRCDATERSAPMAASFDSTSAGASLSRIPASALTISPSAQKVTPSP